MKKNYLFTFTLLFVSQFFFGQITNYSLEPFPEENYTNFYRCFDSEIMIKSFQVTQQPFVTLSLTAPYGFELLEANTDNNYSTSIIIDNYNNTPKTSTIFIRLNQIFDAGSYSGNISINDNYVTRIAQNKPNVGRIAQTSLYVEGEICSVQPCTTPAAPSVVNYGSSTVCSNSSTPLYATSSYSGNDTVYYSWYKNGELISGESTYPYFYPNSYYGSGIYTSKVTINGCTSEASAGTEIIFIESPLTPIINGKENRVLCPGSSITLTTSFEEFDYTKQSNSASRTNYYSEESRYIWYKSSNYEEDEELTETGSSLTVTEPGYYYVQYVNSNGCYSSGYSGVSVTLAPLPTTPIISASGNLSFCAGGSVTLTSTPATSYLWSNGATTRSITVANSGFYSVVTNNGTCSSQPSTARKVTVNPIPKTPTITASGSTSICSGKTVTLTSSSATGNVWSNGANTQSITVGTAGTYSVTASSLGCTSDRSLGTTISINALPTRPTITASGATTFCEGGSVTLTSSATTGIKWSNGAETPSITVTNSGNYTVTVSNGCTSLTSLARTVVVNPLPPSPTISVIGSTNLSPGGSVTLTSSYSTANKWSTGASTRVITVNTPGTYSVSFVGTTCTSKPSLPVIITQNTIETNGRFSNNSQNATSAFSSKIVVYPNPSHGIFNIDTDTDGDVSVINLLGQTVKVVKVRANEQNTVNAESLAKGIYFIKQSNKTQASKLILQN